MRPRDRYERIAIVAGAGTFVLCVALASITRYRSELLGQYLARSASSEDSFAWTHEQLVRIVELRGASDVLYWTAFIAPIAIAAFVLGIRWALSARDVRDEPHHAEHSGSA